MYVIKRSGEQVDFDENKITVAVNKAFQEVQQSDCWDGSVFSEIQSQIEREAFEKDNITVEEIQDIVEQVLMEKKFYKVAKAYIRYRYDHEIARARNTDNELLDMVQGNNEYWETENSNKNPKWVTTQRDYMAGIVSTDIARRYIFPKNVIAAHDAGIIHIHDMDYAAQNTLTNCCLINLADILQNGTVVNGVKIEKPHKLSTAMTIATQVVAAVASSQYGGCTITLSHLAPFVRASHDRYLEKYLDWGFSKENAQKYASIDTKKEISDAVQTLNYQLNSLTTTNGQSPFVSVCLYLGETDEYKTELAALIEEVLRQRIQGMKNRVGVYVTVAFPKLLYVLEEDNIHEDSPYWYLTELAARCTAKRMVPDYISEKVMKRIKVDANGEGHCFPSMGCRSFLSPYLDKSGKPKYYGRFNVGVVTINLADAALSSGGDFNKFWLLLEERTELCHEALKKRIERLCDTRAEVAPILWCDGALARLDPKDKLDKLIHGGNATASLGFSGLYECVKYMTGYSHTAPTGRDFGLKVMHFLNNKCDEWKEQEDIAYSSYGSPIEATTYTFAKHLHERFGKIKGITDRDYITNSYHVPVFEKIDPFSKLEMESEFQELSTGGAISYTETSNLQNNIPAVLEIIKFIYDNIMYAELNTKSDYCQECGYDGEIQLLYNKDKHRHYYKCPNCGNEDTSKMNIARRVCGYISTTVPNEGRLDEIANRYVHLDDHAIGE